MRITLMLIFSLAAMALPVVSQAEPNAQARKTIQALYDKKNAAVARKNATAAAAVFADEFKRVDRHGEIEDSTRDEKSEYYTKIFTATLDGMEGVERTIYKEHDTVLSAKPISGGIVVTEKGDATLIMIAKDGRTAKQYIVGTSRDFWMQNGNTYFLKQSRELNSHESTFLNGKLAPNPK